MGFRIGVYERDQSPQHMLSKAYIYMSPLDRLAQTMLQKLYRHLHTQVHMYIPLKGPAVSRFMLHCIERILGYCLGFACKYIDSLCLSK